MLASLSKQLRLSKLPCEYRGCAVSLIGLNRAVCVIEGVQLARCVTSYGERYLTKDGLTFSF